MAPPDSFKRTVGTAIVLADTTDYSPATANNLGTRTDQIDLTSVSNAAARQSAKVDFGANRAELWNLACAMEIAATPTAGNTIDFYLAPSNSGTAANNNPGGISGSDAAYTGYSSNLSASLKQLMYIGSMVTTAQATGTVQVCMSVGVFAPPERYGTVVVVNNSGAALHSDAVEMSVVLTPIESQVQD